VPTKPPWLAARWMPAMIFGVEIARRDGAGDQRIGAKALLGDLVDEGVRRP